MIRLDSLKFDKVWGYEKWLASTHKAGVQKEFLSALGGSYPLLVKIIKADSSLSVQVHPDDSTAVQLEGEGNVGKTECWYVLDAAPDAQLVYGLNGTYTAEELKAAIDANKLDSYLNLVPVKKDDFIFIPAGTVHAIGGGLTLLEVQQSCDITYRLYDWGRPRELHIEKSLKSIKNSQLDKISAFPGEFSCPYFSLEKITVNGGWSMCASGKNIPENCRLLFILDGEGVIKANGGTNEKISKNDIFALLPGEKVTVEGHLSLMKISAS